jgi:hypothetical protein
MHEGAALTATEQVIVSVLVSALMSELKAIQDRDRHDRGVHNDPRECREGAAEGVSAPLCGGV